MLNCTQYRALRRLEAGDCLSVSEAIALADQELVVIDGLNVRIAPKGEAELAQLRREAARQMGDL